MSGNYLRSYVWIVFWLAISLVKLSAGATIDWPRSDDDTIWEQPKVNQRQSQDPGCIDGFACQIGICDAPCPNGQHCISFAGTVACAPSSDLTWCSVDPSTLEAVGCVPGDICCHGQCWEPDTVCCEAVPTQCELGQVCGVCEPSQTCGQNGQCLGGPASSSSTSSSSTTPPPVSSTTSSRPPPPSSTAVNGTNFPHPVIKGWTAFGDSYSAGIGAGAAVDSSEDTSRCRRRKGSFPFQLNTSPFLSTNPSHEFDFLACSGAVMEDVGVSITPDTQIARWISNSGPSHAGDFATITISGNDVRFVDVLIACVYGAGLATKSCRRAIDDTSLAIEGMQGRLLTVYNNIVRSIDFNGGPSSFQLMVVGYLRFFNVDTDQCDNIKFGYGTGAPRMTKSLRRSLNALVDKLNGVIEDSVSFINKRYRAQRLVYVDANAKFDGHRFCEQGVQEPDADNTNTWFFHLLGADSPNSVDGVIDSPITLSRAECDAAIAANNTDDGIQMACYIRGFFEDNSQLAVPPYLSGDDPQDFFAPEPVGKAFHPKTRGYQAVTEAIDDHIQTSRDPGLWDVVIFFQGTDAELDNMINGLPVTSVPAQSTKISYGTFDLRAYATRLRAEDAEALENSNNNVLGIAFETQLVDDGSGIEIDAQDSSEFNSSGFKKNFTKRDFMTDTDLDLDQAAPVLLTTFSDPPLFQGQKFWNYRGYLHDPDGGKGAHVYVVDSGINSQHTAFQGVAFGNGFSAYNNGNDEYTDTFSHGTSCAGLVSGTVGLAKAVTIHSVKIMADPVSTPVTALTTTKALLWIINEVITNRLEGKAVINFSIGSSAFLFAAPYSNRPATPAAQQVTDIFFHTLPYFNKHDIILVTAAGNDGVTDPSRIDVDTPSRLVQAGLPGENTLVIIGSAQETQAIIKADFSNDYGDLITTYTLGVGVRVPQHDDNDAYVVDEGTSLSAAFASALISTWLVRADFDFVHDNPGAVAATMKSQLREIASFHSTYTDVINAVDVLGTHNYIPCDDADDGSDSSVRNETRGTANLSLIRPRAAQVGTPIRRNNVLVNQGIGEVCFGVISPESISNYHFQGCFKDFEDNRQLSVRAGNFETLDECQITCSRAGFDVFGMENGIECWCGEELRDKTATAPLRECSTMCHLATDEPCGGPTRLDVYEGVPDAIAIEPLPGWSYVACWTDSDNDRTLPTSRLNDPHMTPTLGAQHCAGYAFFGLENGDEAWCANAINPGNPQADSELQCLTPCVGDIGWRCGAADHLNLYRALRTHVLEIWHVSRPDIDGGIDWSWNALHVTDAGGNPTINQPCFTPILQSDIDLFGGDTTPPQRNYGGIEGGCTYTPGQQDDGVGRLTCASGVNVLCFVTPTATQFCGLFSMFPGVRCLW